MIDRRTLLAATPLLAAGALPAQAMQKAGAIEIASARLGPDPDREAFLAASQAMQETFLNGRAGFLSRHVWMSAEDDAVGAVLLWDSTAAAEQAMEDAWDNAEVRAFSGFFAPGSYAVTLAPIMQSWTAGA